MSWHYWLLLLLYYSLITTFYFLLLVMVILWYTFNWQLYTRICGQTIRWSQVENYDVGYLQSSLKTVNLSS